MSFTPSDAGKGAQPRSVPTDHTRNEHDRIFRNPKAGIECPSCGTWNRHEECGTYEVLVPTCKACHNPTELLE